MSSKEWKKYNLGDLAEITSSKRIYLSDYVEVGIPFYRSKEIIQKSLGENLKEILFISTKKYFEIKNKFGIPLNGDLLISAVGERAGIPYVVKNDGDFYFKDGNIIWFKNIDSKLNIDYLYHWIKSYDGKNNIESLMIGSAQKALTIIGLKGLEIILPKIEIQNRIAYILSSLDDKIEMNRQTNQTLECITQTLFQEMCVPNRGELPEEWRVGKLEEVLEIKYGKDHKHLEDGVIPVYGSGGIMRYANKALYEHESILIPRKGTLSNLFYINKPFWSVDTMFYTKIKNKTQGKFLFLLLKTLNLASMNVGSAVPSLTTLVLNNIEITLPPDEIIKKFDDIVTPIFTTLESNEHENQTLIALRDSLLPKLMKGEIKI
jgi:type I restriction enzyme S subunit